jgi:3-oxoadipate enol-lactonase
MPFSRANGVDIWYEVAGDGPPLLLVHANPFDHNLWMYQIAHFSTWFKVVGIDIRGYGRSAKVTTPYSLADQSNDVIGVMKDLGLSQAILGGCSVGSSIALNLGLDHPDLFQAIILVGGNSGPSERAPLRIENYRKDLKGYHIQHLTQLVRPEFATSRLGAYLLNTFVERQPRLVGEAIANVFLASNGIDNTPRAASMRVPTLVINGESDNSLPAGTVTAKLIPGAVHKILSGTGHACCIEDPAGFDALVIEFLKARGLMPKL